MRGGCYTVVDARRRRWRRIASDVGAAAGALRHQGRRCDRRWTRRRDTSHDAPGRPMEAEPGGRSVGEEQIRPVADPRSDRVLQQSVGDVDRWTEQLASGSDGLAHEVATMEDHLQVKVARDRASRADVIGRLLALLASRAERPVDSLQMTEDRVAPPVEGFGRRHGEDGIALELGDSRSRAARPRRRYRAAHPRGRIQQGSLS